MRQKWIVAIAALMVCGLLLPAVAQPRRKNLAVTMTVGVTSNSVTCTDVAGYIDTVTVSCSDGASTGVASVVYLPLVDDMAAVDLATGTVTDEKRWRPSVDRTDTAGSALTADPPARMIVIGDTIRFMLTASETTNAVWHCCIKYDDGK